ncbi:MAG TPA: RNA chaperone Hfq [Terracidiphilus sp.]|nr:RNA chaperone Hfq [Terracidiphilus sp.]
MSPLLTPIAEPATAEAPAWPAPRKNRRVAPHVPFGFSALTHIDQEETAHRQAELFYLQKQIQSQTPMVIVLEDGEQVEGCIEWYDRHTLKVRGRFRMLVFKSAIKYMFKQGENGS